MMCRSQRRKGNSEIGVGSVGMEENEEKSKQAQHKGSQCLCPGQLSRDQSMPTMRRSGQVKWDIGIKLGARVPVCTRKRREKFEILAQGHCASAVKSRPESLNAKRLAQECPYA